jgi:hypothetical protein
VIVDREPAPVPGGGGLNKRVLLFCLEALGVAALLVVIGMAVLRRDTESGPGKSRSRKTGIEREDGKTEDLAPPPAVTVRVVETPSPPPREPAPPSPGLPVSPGPSEPAPAAPGKPAPSAEPNWKKQVDQNVALLNMAGIVAEVMRQKSDTVGYERMTSLMALYERRIRDGLAKLVEKGTPYNISMSLAPQDRILSFSGKELFRMTPREAAAFLQIWTKTWQPGALEKCSVLRGESVLEISMFFPERNRSLLTIIQASGAQVEDTTLWPITLASVPDVLVKEVTERFGALHPGYRKLVPPEELEVMERLLKNGRGFPDEVDFLTMRIVGDLLPRFEQESARCREKAKEMESILGDTISDVLVMKDGRVIEGKVLREDESGLVVGIGVGTVRFSLADVAEVQRGKGASGEFPARFKAAQGKLEVLASLLAWCKNNHLLARQRECLAGLILTKDPLNDGARVALGLPRSFALDRSPKPIPEPPPPPPVARRPAEGHPDDDVFKKVSAVAEDVARKYKAFSDVIYQMRDRTAGLVYSKVVPIPDRFSHIAQLIVDPIAFRAISLNRDQANTVQVWWKDLDLGNREDFARFFGLWCITCRSMK